LKQTVIVISKLIRFFYRKTTTFEVVYKPFSRQSQSKRGYIYIG